MRVAGFCSNPSYCSAIEPFRPVSRRFVAGHLAIKRPLNAHQPPMGDIVEL